jgi:hypothetical protein
VPDERTPLSEIDALPWGDRLAVLAFRAYVHKANMMPIEEAFSRTAGPEARAGFDAFMALMDACAHGRRRPLDAAMTRSGDLTHDERALVAALVAVGSDGDEAAAARLAWLAGRTPDPLLVSHLRTAARALRGGGGEPAR